MNQLSLIIFFVLGSTIGSFLSVVIHRLHHQEKGIISGRSQCPNCKNKLKWQEMIPIFSWLYLKGHCRHCRKAISSHYFVLELTTAILFALFFLNWQSIPVLSFYLIELSFLIAIFFYDLMYKEIPDQLSLPAIVIALIGNLFLGLIDIESMLIGAFVLAGFFLLQFILSQGKWIGGGDIRLGLLMGLLLGWQQGLLALALAYILGGFISLFLLSQAKIRKNSEIAFGPFLVTATIIAMLKGPEILDWYLGF